ncbi:hypothetical protein JCM33374_g4702 [Metschnikowia sp. JCM 33374]|nr:hypothetical protein JCM33374_g4702 [Metschnikowia sp. JCM 33374]
MATATTASSSMSVAAGFVYESHRGSRAAHLTVNTAALAGHGAPESVSTYYNGGGMFMDASRYRGVEILARYQGVTDVRDESADLAAVIYCKVGKGDVVLSGVHPEYTPSLMKPAADDLHFKAVAADLEQSDESRKLFLGACLSKVGLKVNRDPSSTVPRLTPIYLTSHLDPPVAQKVVADLRANLDFVGPNTFEDINDTFVLHEETEDDHTYMLSDGGVNAEKQSLEDLAASEKHIKAFTSVALPDSRTTPYFDMKLYFDTLKKLYDENAVSLSDRAFGSLLLYSEVVTSTNTLLDANPNWLRHLPMGLTFTATTQVAGRGRGGNVWVNPKGVMATSVLFRVPVEAQKNSSIVTLQYLCALAVIESILGYVSQRRVLLGVGCGVNVSNQAPTTSLNSVLEKLNEIRVQKGLEPLPPYNHEALLAKVMYTLGQFYSVFQKSGLKPFLSLYYKRWFHSNQRVKLDAEGNGKTRECVIKGITPEYGLLVAEDISTRESLELQPDGNSFDIFKGLEVNSKQSQITYNMCEWTYWWHEIEFKTNALKRCWRQVTRD